MKKSILLSVCMVTIMASAYCGGAISAEPVNMQEIELENIDTILVHYNSEQITLLNSNTNTITLKEYMNINNSSHYAQISNSGNELVIKAGRRPAMRNFRARVEIFIPVSNKNITIRTSSGNITGENEYTASTMNFNSSSGDISINSITANNIKFTASSGNIQCNNTNGNTFIKTNSGNIIFNSVNGDVSSESSSGRIEIKQTTGSLTANTSSGNINCSITENAGDVSITTSSGSVILAIPENFAFNFLSRTSSGRLNTPFSDKLSSPFTDRDSVQGVIGGKNTSINSELLKNIYIRTSSGPITVNWIN